ncbi:hypothetical protein ACFFGH_23705 [Lysobacter korlensis]|uniref:Phytase-like domain-containing protein n=1 Tax=Lysobacter korlensis TaxID=553636 RepID=A0ABV6RY99_9GAMM
MRTVRPALARVADRRSHPASADVPRRANGGWWSTSHVQGVAADLERGHLYYSFTTLLVKTDFAGAVLGTVEGFTGHLGDVTFDPAGRRLYASLEYKAAAAFYVAVFDVDAIDRPGLLAADSDVVRTVHLAEVAADYAADTDGSGTFDGDRADTADHRYGCSGIDGISLGPAFGSASESRLLTVAYGVYANLERHDNDHQVLLQYRLEEWDGLALPLDEAAPHRSGPAAPDGKYFVRTGNTRFGVQNLEYDSWSGRWFLGVYAGSKPWFPNYTLFAVDATAAPVTGPLIGIPGERGPLLQLADDGLWDPVTGIRGWYEKADVGLESLGDGRFLLSSASAFAGLQTSDLALCRWTGDPAHPFEPLPVRGRRASRSRQADSLAFQL